MQTTVLNGLEAWALQDSSIDLLIWTVYRYPIDCPDKFVARPFNGRTDAAYPLVLIANSLEELRDQIPPGLICFGRDERDDPVIVEVWM